MYPLSEERLRERKAEKIMLHSYGIEITKKKQKNKNKTKKRSLYRCTTAAANCAVCSWKTRNALQKYIVQTAFELLKMSDFVGFQPYQYVINAAYEGRKIPNSNIFSCWAIYFYFFSLKFSDCATISLCNNLFVQQQLFKLAQIKYSYAHTILTFFLC